MKKVPLYMTVLLLLNCGRSDKSYATFTSPRLERGVRLEISGGGAGYSVGDWDPSSKTYGRRYRFAEEEYSRSFVGWSPDSATISILSCRQGGPELLRRTFLKPSSLGLTNHWDSFRLADENLVSSLKLVRANAPERGTPQVGEFEWFCQSGGRTALSAYTKLVDEIEEVSVPYQTTK